MASASVKVDTAAEGSTARVAVTPTSNPYPNVFVSQHPVLLAKLTQLRSKDTTSTRFRALLREITFYLGYEISRDLPTKEVPYETPVGKGVGAELSDRIALIPVMRAGLGMVEPMLDLIPHGKVHHIGIYREEKTLCCILYYNRLPAKVDSDVAIVLEPLIATGNTLDATLIILKQWGVKQIRVMSILATHDGIKKLQEAHPDVELHVGAIDDELTSTGMIVPGLGDVGDRLWGTYMEKPHTAAQIVAESNVAVQGAILISDGGASAGAGGAGADAADGSRKRGRSD